MTHLKPLFTMHCPAGTNPRPLIELAMQVRFNEVPHYKYSWADPQSVAVTVHEGLDDVRPQPRLTVRRIKVFVIIILLGLLLLYEQRWQNKSVSLQIERNHLNNRTYHAAKRLAAIKMNKALRAILARPLYIRSLEITPKGWKVDAMGPEAEIKKLSASWQTTLPVMSSQNGLVIINGGGTW